MGSILNWLREMARLPRQVYLEVERRNANAKPIGNRKLNPPGPSPWCLRRMKIKSPAGILRWSTYDGPTLAGISRLYTPKGETLVLLDFKCYVTSLPNGKLLLWCDRSRTSTGEVADNPLIHLDVIDLACLEPIADPSTTAARMREAKQHRYIAGRPFAEFEFATTRPPGQHSLSNLPLPFQEIDETIVLADYEPDGQVPGNLVERRAIYVFNFHDGQVEVIPQDWFNNGDYDFLYQWIARVARDPKTGRLLGEGVRLRAFRLGESGREVEEWLDRSPFSPTTG